MILKIVIPVQSWFFQYFAVQHTVLFCCFLTRECTLTSVFNRAAINESFSWSINFSSDWLIDESTHRSSSTVCILVFTFDFDNFPVSMKGNLKATAKSFIFYIIVSRCQVCVNVNHVCACPVVHSWAGCWQSHGVEVCWWSLWRKHQAHSLPLPHAEDAADSAWERHHRRVHQKWGFQVSYLC